MDKVEKAREIFQELEAKHRSYGELAQRNFEIQSRLARIRS